MENQDFKKEIKDLKKRLLALEKENKLLLEDNDNLKISVESKTDELQQIIKKVEIAKQNKKAVRYKMVTVLFSEVKGFSRLTEDHNTEELIDKLDNFFFHFDLFIKKHNLQKTTTVGDAYMCAGGIPKKNRTNPIEVVMAALEMRQHLLNLQEESEKINQTIWDLTFGIHTGSVSAEKKGKKKISYEIKGDTVNIASRIESSCELGKITISDVTYEFVQEYFRCDYRGKVPVKYMGDIAVYDVKGFRPEYSIDGKGILPNSKFLTKFALIKFDDLEEVILDKLERELPEHLYYHNLKHTIDVTIQVEIIGTGEGVSNEELLLLKTAALFHDLGHTIESLNHEYHGTVLVREILPSYYYSQEQIDIICDIIMATKLPPQPKTLLEKIICDADLDYLGRADFIPVSDTLFKELKAQNIITNIDDWNKMQVKFISSHQYFTKTANLFREVNKQKQIDRIKHLIPDYKD